METISPSDERPTARLTFSHGEKTMLAGGVAGCVAKTVTAPLSRLTLLLQVSPMISSHAASSGTVSMAKERELSGSLYKVCRRIVREEGLLSLWKGNLTSVIHRFPYSAINFTAYDTITKLMKGQRIRETPTTRFLSGASAGGIACVACYPLDLVRTRLMASRTPQNALAEAPMSSSGSSPAGASSSVRRTVMGTITSTMLKIIHDEGYSGLYRGLLISLWVTLPTFGISFCVYGTAKENILHLDSKTTPFPLSLLKDSTTGHLSPYGSMLSGAMSGVTSSLLLFPADVVRRRMQVAGLLKAQAIESSPKSSSHINLNLLPGGRGGALAEMLRMVRSGGVRGLYRGLFPEILKITPMVSITFMVYEFVLDIIDDE